MFLQKEVTRYGNSVKSHTAVHIKSVQADEPRQSADLELTIKPPLQKKVGSSFEITSNIFYIFVTEESNCMLSC